MELWWGWGHVQKDNQLQPNVYQSCFHDLSSRTSRVRGLTLSPGAPLHCFVIPASAKQALTRHLNFSACDLQTVTTCPNPTKDALCIFYVCSVCLNICIYERTPGRSRNSSNSATSFRLGWATTGVYQRQQWDPEHSKTVGNLVVVINRISVIVHSHPQYSPLVGRILHLCQWGGVEIISEEVNGGCFNWRPERKSSLGSFTLFSWHSARATFTLALNCSSIPAWNAWSDGNDVILVSYDIRCKWVSVSEDEHNSQTAKSPWEPG